MISKLSQLKLLKLKSSPIYYFLIAILSAYFVVTVRSSPARMYALWEVGPSINIERKKKNLLFSK